MSPGPSKPSASHKVTGDRDQVFAQAALKKGLVSRDQARECLQIARGLAAKNKPLN